MLEIHFFPENTCVKFNLKLKSGLLALILTMIGQGRVKEILVKMPSDVSEEEGVAVNSRKSHGKVCFLSKSQTTFQNFSIAHYFHLGKFLPLAYMPQNAEGRSRY